MLKHLFFIPQTRARGIASSAPGRQGVFFCVCGVWWGRGDPTVEGVSIFQTATQQLPVVTGWEGKRKDEGRNQFPTVQKYS